MPLMTHAAWEALEAAEAACREGRFPDAWEALGRLSVLDPSNLRARFITARLSLAEGAFSRAADLIEDYLSLATADKDTPREDIRDARLMAALLAARVGENDTAEKQLTACFPLSSEGDNYKLHHLISSLEFMALIIGHRMKGKNPFLFANPALLDAHITHHTIPLLAHDALQTTGQCCCQIDL